MKSVCRFKKNKITATHSVSENLKMLTLRYLVVSVKALQTYLTSIKRVSTLLVRQRHCNAETSGD